MTETFDCAICMEELSQQESPLQCGHVFHKNCILKCLKLTCPLCRANISLSNDDLQQWKRLHKITSLEVNSSSHREYITLDLPNPFNFNLNTIPFDDIEQIIVSEVPNRQFSFTRINQITNIIGSVYPELMLMTNPESHVFSVLYTNGYSLN